MTSWDNFEIDVHGVIWKGKKTLKLNISNNAQNDSSRYSEKTLNSYYYNFCYLTAVTYEVMAIPCWKLEAFGHCLPRAMVLTLNSNKTTVCGARAVIEFGPHNGEIQVSLGITLCVV